MLNIHAGFRVLLLLISTALVGCAATQPFPNAARAGDTITLAVGSADDVTPENTTVTFYSDSDPGTPVDLTPGIRSIFNLYPDPKSDAWTDTGFVEALKGGTRHDSWITIIALDLPAIIPEGQGTISIDSGGTFHPFLPSVNDFDLTFEILPGAGASNPLEYATQYGVTETGDLSRLEAQPHVLFKPDVTGLTGVVYGAMEFVLDVPIADVFGDPAPDNKVYVVSEFRKEAYTNRFAHISWVREGSSMQVNMVAPNGMAPMRARFSIVGLPVTSFQYTPGIISSRFFDLDGNEITGPPMSVTFRQ